MDEARAARRRRQLDALWKWEWLGLRDSTPAFKASLVLIAIAFLVVLGKAFLG